MARREPRIIVIGASAGGLQPLQSIVARLPSDLPASVFVVVHLMPGSVSALPTILERSGPLPARHPDDQTPITPGTIYVAPPDRHMLIEDHLVRVLLGPRENGFRPAIDVLFRTAAEVFGNRVAGVILSGSLDDGTVGLGHIKRLGGATIVQEPDEAMFRGMPQSAIAHVEIDHRLPADRIADVLIDFALRPSLMPESGAEEIEPESSNPYPPGEEVKTTSSPSVFGCPECGGVLFERGNGDLFHFRCHVGHAFSPSSLLNGQQSSLESALWTALRVLEDHIELAERLAARFRRSGNEAVVDRFRSRAREAEQRVSIIRKVLLTGPNSQDLISDQFIERVMMPESHEPNDGN